MQNHGHHRHPPHSVGLQFNNSASEFLSLANNTLFKLHFKKKVFTECEECPATFHFGDNSTSASNIAKLVFSESH